MNAWEFCTRLGTVIAVWTAELRPDSASLAKRLRAHEGQALIETVMTTGFLVAFALFLDKTLIPIVAQAFEHIANALSSVGP
jgi:hypothetical protein